ncbi:ganglioside induced differentiation associated protein [Culex quinquefasciatus]|uniref:Ganglioside induced differentiation associated protein n=1 Tax=Culex quinquefasciatus TaxID=7176 RepID=B0XCG4_CULQU|nr:ganglioside induced differentiation associated protein [Culex quinquefasciatus]|eukprot:XP_001867336.1 ganglioside induced differentiation associated protein [Culex quinquefasciatus]
MRLVSDIYNESIEPSLGGITKPLTQQYVSVEQLTPWGSKEDSSSSSATSRPRTADYHSHIQCGAEGPRHDASPFPWDDQINQRIVICWQKFLKKIVKILVNCFFMCNYGKNMNKCVFLRSNTQTTLKLVHLSINLCSLHECFLGKIYLVHGRNRTRTWTIVNFATKCFCYKHIMPRDMFPSNATFLNISLLRLPSCNPRTTCCVSGVTSHVQVLGRFGASVCFCLLFSNREWPRDIKCLRARSSTISAGCWPESCSIYLAHTHTHILISFWYWILIVLFVVSLSADDDSDTSPHDLEMGSDVEYNNINLSLASHLGGGTHSFTHMQGDLDRQRLLGDRPRMVYESVVDDGLEGIEHQER